MAATATATPTDERAGGAGSSQKAAHSPVDSVRSSFLPCAFLLAVYSFFLGELHYSRILWFEVGKIGVAMAAFSYLTGCMTVVFIFTMLLNKDNITKCILHKTLIIYIVCVSASFYSVVTLFGRSQTTLLWHLPHLVGSLMLLRLIHRLLKELSPEYELLFEVPVPPTKGWLKSLLVQLSPEPLTANDKNPSKSLPEEPAAIRNIPTLSLAVTSGPTTPSCCCDLAPVHLPRPPTRTSAETPELPTQR